MLKENEDKSINLTHIFLGNKGLRYLTDSPNPKIKEATVSSTQQKYCIRGTISLVMFLAIIYYVLYDECNDAHSFTFYCCNNST